MAKKEATGFNAPKTLTPELAAVVGKKTLSRAATTKALWVYIKANKLQSAKDGRMIEPDAKLAAVFGTKKPVNMMKMAGLIGKHLS